ncbi:MAG: AI-2E family transporter [Candidatus Kapabacteria bacterium]|nr:AI-2E family transporter [Candidatus Kapabacteria bacterium]MCS7169902.1 AI-2E family transporter [Candidatus Kapabacteria bacterium]MDW7997674.1 AI-2E family transporter [Bacteroidota bacterium]MDW8224519.1 AI-2E family transporter [Bacteroidota bacterium]
MPLPERGPYLWLLLLFTGVALGTFLVLTGLALVPFIVLLFGVLLVYPYRHQSRLAHHLLWLLVLAFAVWLLQAMGLLLLPFAIALLVGYLFDPWLRHLQHRGIPRWLSALSIVLALIGAVSALAMLIFPTIFTQLDTLIKQISTLYNAATTYLESRRFFQTLARHGIPPELVQEVLHRGILPRLEEALQTLMSSLLTALAGLSRILTHVVNLLLLPIVMFYLVKDFPQLQALLAEVLQRKAPRALQILQQASPIVRTYLGWVLFVSTLMGLFSGALYVLFGVPYGVMLGLLSGVLNPIPYFGILIVMGTGLVVILIAQSADFLRDFLIFAAIINGLHFLNAYVIEPRVLGKRIGVHPVVLILSLLLFGSLFGFVGLLIAVPTTAVAALLFNQWRQITPPELVHVPSDVEHVP